MYMYVYAFIYQRQKIYYPLKGNFNYENRHLCDKLKDMTASNSKDADQRVPSEALWFASVQFAYEPCVNKLNVDTCRNIDGRHIGQ